jgi:hypothetical protein
MAESPDNNAHTGWGQAILDDDVIKTEIQAEEG